MPRNLRAALRVSLTIVLLGVVVPLVLLEALLRLFGPSLPGQLGVVARTITTGQPYAESWTPAWQLNDAHYHALRPGIDNSLQYGSATVSFRLTTTEPWAGAGIGIRNRPVDYRVDAVVVGDSFGFCFTEQESCWVTLLEDATRLGIVNLSQPVTGSLSHARMLQDFAAAWQPPLVIWQFFGNDFNDDYALLNWRGDIEAIPDAADAVQTSTTPDPGPLDWLRRNLVVFGAGEMLFTGAWSGTPDERAAYAPHYSVTYGDNYTLEFGALYEQVALDMARPANQFGMQQSRAALEASQALAAGWGGQLVVVMIPTREEVYAELTEPLMGTAALDKHRSARLAMLDLCELLSLRCLDLLPGLRANRDNALYYTDDMHLTPAGNAVVAQLVEAYLRTEIRTQVGSIEDMKSTWQKPS